MPAQSTASACSDAADRPEGATTSQMPQAETKTQLRRRRRKEKAAATNARQRLRRIKNQGVFADLLIDDPGDLTGEWTKKKKKKKNMENESGGENIVSGSHPSNDAANPPLQPPEPSLAPPEPQTVAPADSVAAMFDDDGDGINADAPFCRIW